MTVATQTMLDAVQAALLAFATNPIEEYSANVGGAGLMMFRRADIAKLRTWEADLLARSAAERSAESGGTINYYRRGAV